MPELDCLVSGYLRQEFLRSNDYQYPESLTVIFIHFLGNILFGFDLICDKYKHFVSDDRKILEIDEMSGYITVGSSYPLNSGIYTIVVQLSDDAVNPIGIISDHSICKEDDMWIFRAKDSYIFALYGLELVQSDLADEYFNNEYETADIDEIDEHDRLKMIINCNEWKLSYYLNDKELITDVQIAKDTTHYFAICTGRAWSNSKYAIILFDYEP